MLNLTKAQLDIVREQLASRIYDIKKSLVMERERGEKFRESVESRERAINLLRDYEDFLARIDAEYSRLAD